LIAQADTAESSVIERKQEKVQKMVKQLKKEINHSMKEIMGVSIASCTRKHIAFLIPSD